MPTINDIISIIENFAPIPLEESYDNSGLQIGDRTQVATSALVCIDVTEKVLDEAITIGTNLIISHHPLIFKGLKSITGHNYIERIIIKAIRHNVAIYAAHTNLDTVWGGVNHKLAEKIGLQNIQLLDPKKEGLQKLVVYTPLNFTERVEQALFQAGAGKIGQYEECSYILSGKGQFKPMDKAHPYCGEIDKRQQVDEDRIEVIFPHFRQKAILSALKAVHPYEEPAFDIISLDNLWTDAGIGAYGDLAEPIDEIVFLNQLKEVLNIPAIRYSDLRGKPIRRVALCGGSGSSLIPQAKQVGADLFITADIKYHDFFGLDNHLVIADFGHYETEQYTKEIFYELITKKIPTFAVYYTTEKTNPINYL